jgi:hypothetical protein
MSIDFAPTLQTKFHAKKAYSTTALTTFIERCPKLVSAQYLDSIIVKLEAFGWISARDRICEIIGTTINHNEQPVAAPASNAAKMKRDVVTDSPNVSEITHFLCY